MKAIKTLYLWLTHYMVAAEWEGIRKVHWAKTEDEAREWMGCYPDGLALYGKRGKLLGARWM